METTSMEMTSMEMTSMEMTSMEMTPMEMTSMEMTSLYLCRPWEFWIGDERSLRFVAKEDHCSCCENTETGRYSQPASEFAPDFYPMPLSHVSFICWCRREGSSPLQ